MLATILRTSVAEQVSIAIMDAFVEMRRYIKSNNYDKRISNIETKIIEICNNYENVTYIDIFGAKNYIAPNDNHPTYEGQEYISKQIIKKLK